MCKSVIYLGIAVRQRRYYRMLMGNNVAYRIMPFPMILNDFQGHSRIATIFQKVFSYICAAVDIFQLTLRACSPCAIAELLVMKSATSLRVNR